jgi:translocation and assembly module TamA
LLQTGEPAPRSVLEKRNRAQSLARSVEDLLASEGYLAVEVLPEEMTTLDGSSELLVRPGPVFTIATVNLVGADPIDAETRQVIDSALAKLPAGSSVRTVDVERIEAEIITLLQARGYAFASSPGIDALASRQDANVEITYTVSPGPLVRLGDLESDETDPRSQKAIQVLKTWEDGATYNPRTVDRLRSRLRSSGLYERIGVVIS